MLLGIISRFFYFVQGQQPTSTIQFSKGQFLTDKQRCGSLKLSPSNQSSTTFRNP